MAINGNFSGNLEKSEHLDLTGTTATTVGDTASDFSRILVSFAFCNKSAGAVTCQLIHRVANTTDYTVWTASVATNSTAIVDNMPIRLQNTDSIKVVGANNVTVTLTYLATYAFTGA